MSEPAPSIDSTVVLPTPSVRCTCGKFHDVAVNEVVIDETAVARLVTFVTRAKWSSPFVVMDSNTADVLGARVVSELRSGGLSVGHHSYAERRGLLADESGVERLEAAVADSPGDVLIAVGSGVITDLTRYVAHRRRLPFLAVPTAASMDGYASGVAAMEFNGMKVTSVAVAPRAIFADPSITAAAPVSMTRSGIGDLLGKASAHTDWRLSHALFGEELCEVVERRVAGPMLDVATNVEGIVRGDRASNVQLLKGLIESGIAMAMVGSSRPASGCEHHASHFWDLLSQRGRHGHSAHGLQVGFATHFALRLQRWALAADRELPVQPGPRPIKGDDAGSWFVGHDVEVDAVLAEKAEFLLRHQANWPRNQLEWEHVRQATTASSDHAELVDRALILAGIPFAAGYLDLDAATISATFRFANRIRARYTVLDFLEGQGLLEEAIAAVMSQVGSSFSSL